MPHRQDFKGNFQAPSLPSPDEFEQGRGEAGWKRRSRGISCGRRRCDNHQRHRNRSWLRHGQEDRLSSCFCLPGWWKVLHLCGGVARCADECSPGWEWRATKYYSHHPGRLLWALPCRHGRQNPAVISIDSPYYLEPVNEAGVSSLGSGAVLQRPGRDPCAPAYGKREASLYSQPKNEILSGVRSRIWRL